MGGLVERIREFVDPYFEQDYSDWDLTTDNMSEAVDLLTELLSAYEQAHEIAEASRALYEAEQQIIELRRKHQELLHRTVMFSWERPGHGLEVKSALDKVTEALRQHGDARRALVYVLTGKR